MKHLFYEVHIWKSLILFGIQMFCIFFSQLCSPYMCVGEYFIQNNRKTLVINKKIIDVGRRLENILKWVRWIKKFVPKNLEKSSPVSTRIYRIVSFHSRK